MFLDEYPCWEVGELHHPLILQEMFFQAAYLGQKEAEWMIYQGHQHGLLQLDPEAGISAIEFVGYLITKEEIRNLYHQIYKLRRLPWPPLCGLDQAQELTRDIVSSLKNHLRWRGGEQPGRHEEPEPANICPSQDRMSQRVRWGTLGERELTEAREAHRWVLAAAATLEQWIERLSRSTTRVRLDACIHSQSQDWWRRSQG